MVNTGFLAFVVLLSTALTVPASMLLLWLYRRSVLRGMIADAGPGQSETSGMSETRQRLAAAAAPSGPLTFSVLDGSTAVTSHYDRAHHACHASLRVAAFVYALGGLAFALVFVMAWAFQVSDGSRVAGRVLWLMACYWWPTVLAIGLLRATSRADWLRLIGAYGIAIALFGAYSLSRNPGLTAFQLLTFWALTNLPPSILLLGFLQRRVRAVGPLVLAFLAAGVFGSQAAVSLTGRSDQSMRAAISWGTAFGLGATGVLAATVLVGFLCVALAGWWLLRRVGALYQRRLFSDQTLMFDALFLFFGLVQAIGMAPSGLRYLLAGPAAFLAYRITCWAGFRMLLARRPTGGTTPVLLVLRVFSLGRRSEKLFDALSKAWRRAGIILMIAGPDLVTTTVEPHEFLDFVGGKMSRRFVTGESDVAERVAALDDKPDPDGRYRVHEFFCRRDTWQLTMRRLVHESTGVLMDLRSFSPCNEGCAYELAQLLNLIDLERVIFVIDSTTDRLHFEQTLQSIWRTTTAESPNYSQPAPVARLFVVEHQSAAEVRSLLRLLLLRPQSRILDA